MTVIVSEHLLSTVFISTEVKIDKRIKAGITEERNGNTNTKQKTFWKSGSYVGKEKESVKERSNQYVKINYETVPNDNKWDKPVWISEFFLIKEEAGELLWKQSPLL